MRKRPHIIFILALCFSVKNISAQSLSPSVISSSGTVYSNSISNLSFTTGEMSMIETFSVGNSILTQGFQQPFQLGVNIKEESTNSLLMFPNPTSGNITIVLPGNYNGEITTNMYDVIGKLVYHKTFICTPETTTIRLLLTEFSDGLYMLELKTKTEYYLNKLNIIK